MAGRLDSTFAFEDFVPRRIGPLTSQTYDVVRGDDWLGERARLGKADGGRSRGAA